MSRQKGDRGHCRRCTEPGHTVRRCPKARPKASPRQVDLLRALAEHPPHLHPDVSLASLGAALDITKQAVSPLIARCVRDRFLVRYGPGVGVDLTKAGERAIAR